jgi:beta-exotoxin I transport system permease protein
MVMRSLFAKTLYDARKSLLGWILGLVAAAGLVLVMYPVVRTGSYQETLENSPETLLSAFGMDRDMDLTMGSGYLTAYLFGMMVPLLLMVFAISHGARLVAGEEDRGTLDLLAALPVSRTRVLLVKAVALLVTLGLLGVALGITVIAAAPLVDLRVEIAGLAAAVLSQVLLAALFGALALGLGAATGRHGLAIGASTALAVGAYLVRSLGALTNASEWLQRISPVYWAVGNDPMLNGVGVGLIARAAATGAVVGASTRALADRDLRV